MREKEQIFNLIGKTIWVSQLIESDLKILLICASHNEIKDNNDLNKKEDEHSRKPLGFLINKLRDKKEFFRPLGLEDSNFDVLEKCLTSRNFVTHNVIAREEGGEVQLSSARKELIRQLEENLCDVEKGNELIHNILLKIARTLNVDYEQLEQDLVGDFERDS